MSNNANRGANPQTPPYTPLHRNKGKRPLSRSESPASPVSIHPTETTSPAKKAAKKRATSAEVDQVLVEELDAGYQTDTSVVYPETLEEASSPRSATLEASDPMESDSDAEMTDGETRGLSRRLSLLYCGDENAKELFEKGRRERRMSKRLSARMFKRSHSQSVKGDSEELEDMTASQKKLRRTREDVLEGSPAGVAVASSPPDTPAGTARPGGSDAMDVDRARG